MTTQKLPKVFIVGESGTTGLRLHDRLISRSDIELLSLPDEKRKDIPTIVEYAKNADLMFLCLPDDASREIVKATEGTGIRILDTSTAHRTKEDWVYGFPELSSAQYKAISQAERSPSPAATPAVRSLSCIRSSTQASFRSITRSTSYPSPATAAAAKK